MSRRRRPPARRGCRNGKIRPRAFYPFPFLSMKLGTSGYFPGVPLSFFAPKTYFPSMFYAGKNRETTAARHCKTRAGTVGTAHRQAIPPLKIPLFPQKHIFKNFLHGKMQFYLHESAFAVAYTPLRLMTTCRMGLHADTGRPAANGAEQWQLHGTILSPPSPVLRRERERERERD